MKWLVLAEFLLVIVICLVMRFVEKHKEQKLASRIFDLIIDRACKANNENKGVRENNERN